MIELESVEKAMQIHDGAGYQAGLQAVDDACERDLRIVEGLD